MQPMSFDGLVERARAFQESRALLTAIELDVFTAVGSGAPAEAVAERLATNPRATEMLLNALVALGALTKTQGTFRNTAETARYLSGSSPDNQRLALMHAVHLWDRWSTLTRCVRSGTARRSKVATPRGEGWTTAFIAAMHSNAAQRATAVVEAVGAQGIRRVLDVGGGSGAYSIAFAQANPGLRVDILDLPEVLRIAKGHIARAGMAKRIKTKSGDLRTDALGRGYDLVFISAICHMLSPAENLDLFRRSFRALAPGGRMAVRDFVLDPDKTAPRAAAMFSLNMLVGTAGGASYSEPEYAAWFRAAGFNQIRRINLHQPGSDLMIGVK